MQKVKEEIEKQIRGKESGFLFTGDKGSTLLLNVLNDMNVNIVFIDTGYQFDETMDYVKNLSTIIEIIKNNNASIDHTVDKSKCCSQRKVETLKEYLNKVKAECLIVPFRNEEKVNGIEDSYLNGVGNIEIIRPLAQLREQDIWIKIKENKLQFSSLYHKGYRIVDCRSCTTRHGRRKQSENVHNDTLDKEIQEKLKSLGYL